MLFSVAKKHIPRGYRKAYIPGWSQECTELYKQYVESHETEVADELFQCLDSAKKEKWHALRDQMSFQHASKKAWSLLTKLGDSSMKQIRNIGKMSPNDIAIIILNLTRKTSGINKEITSEIKREKKSQSQ